MKIYVCMERWLELLFMQQIPADVAENGLTLGVIGDKIDPLHRDTFSRAV